MKYLDIIIIAKDLFENVQTSNHPKNMESKDTEIKDTPSRHANNELLELLKKPEHENYISRSLSKVLHVCKTQTESEVEEKIKNANLVKNF